MEDAFSGSLGLDPITIVARIVATHPEIQRVFFGQPNVNPPLQARCELSLLDRQVIRRAEEQWKQQHYNLPFWDTVMLSLLHSKAIPGRLLGGAAFHQSISKTQFQVSSEDVLSVQKVRELAQRLPPNKMLTICSKVGLSDGSTRHIPMMDFHCPVGDYSLSLVCQVAKLFRVGQGFIVETERSYHFYGTRLLSGSELANFLGRALLFSPVVDRTWIAHQMIDMCCALRISAGQHHGQVSRVVGLVK